MDNNREQCCKEAAISKLGARWVAREFDESLVAMHLSLRKHRGRLLRDIRVVGEDEFRDRVRCKWERRTNIQSTKKSIIFTVFSINFIQIFTSDNDRTGTLTQSSQHFPKSVSKTRAGEIPSHCVLNCNCRRFNWQNISVKNAMNAVNRGRDGFFELGIEPRTLSRSWYHWRHVFSIASKKVSFCSFEMMEIHKREIGSENLGNWKCETCVHVQCNE